MHRSASGGRRKKSLIIRQDTRAIGTSPGKCNTKVHLIADAHGRPRVIRLTGSHRHDKVAAQGVLENLPPNLHVMADAAYDTEALRNCRPVGASRTVIPNPKNRKKPFSLDAVTYKRFNVVERTFCRLKNFRRLATRYDRLDATFLATLCIASTFAYFLK